MLHLMGKPPPALVFDDVRRRFDRAAPAFDDADFVHRTTFDELMQRHSLINDFVFGTALVWAVVYDTFYAMVDRDDDLKVGVKSTAILFGDADLFVIGGLQLLMIIALIFIGNMAELGFWYYSSVAIAAILMAWHQWRARERQPAACFEVFLHNHYIGMIVFIGIVLHYTFAPVAPA